jgi:hypothetical protein
MIKPDSSVEIYFVLRHLFQRYRYLTVEKDRANMKRVLRDTAPLCDLLQTAIYDYWR